MLEHGLARGFGQPGGAREPRRGSLDPFQLAEEVGEAGKRADLLVLERDPRENAEALDSIALVIVGGEIHAREELSARPRRRR